MSDLKPGEFVSPYGDVWSIEGIRVGRGESGAGRCSVTRLPDHPDFPAALEALNALHEDAQWVEYDEGAYTGRVNKATGAVEFYKKDDHYKTRFPGESETLAVQAFARALAELEGME